MESLQSLQLNFEIFRSILETQYNTLTQEVKNLYQETTVTVIELPYETYYNLSFLFVQEHMEMIGIGLLLVMMIMVIMMQFTSKRKQGEIISSLQNTESMVNFRLKAKISLLEGELEELHEQYEKVKTENEYIHKLRQNKAGYIKVTGDPSDRKERKEMKKFGTYLGNKVYLVSMKHMGNFRNRLVTH